jgi:hypothetical protein
MMPQWVEKLIWMLVPLLISSVGYLLKELGELRHEVTVLNNKISLVVTADNKQAANTGSELAREKLRQEVDKEIQHNRDMILENRARISVLEERTRKH